MTFNPEARSRRLIPRYPLTQEVLVRAPGMACRRYSARDVSQGGFFLETQDPFELFCDIELEVTLPGERTARWTGRVVHLLSPEQALRCGMPAGIGIQFEGLSETQLEQVREFVAWARARDPRPRVARCLPNVSADALRGQPLLSYVLEHIDGARDPEALAEELGLEVGSVERMLRELCRLQMIELWPAEAARRGSLAPQPEEAPAAMPPTAAHRSTSGAGADHASDDGAGERAPAAQTAQTSTHDRRASGPSAKNEAPTPLHGPVLAEGLEGRGLAHSEALDPRRAALLEGLEQRLTQGDFYSWLDLPRNADSEAIRAAFHAQNAALQLPSAPAGAAPRIERAREQLREAYGILSSPHKRAEYDAYLERSRQLADAGAMRAVRSPSPHASTPSAGAVSHAAGPRRANERRAAAVPRPQRADAQPEPAAPLGAAAQILAEAEQALAAGKMTDAGKHLQLLTAMQFDDTKIRARVAQLKLLVARALAGDFERQATYEEKQQRWAKAARSWMRVAEGRPQDGLPLQRAALAQLQAGGDLRKAMEVAKRAVELAQHDPQARRTLARVYVAAGMQASARRELEAAQRCQPGPESPATPKQTAGLFKRLWGRDAPN